MCKAVLFFCSLGLEWILTECFQFYESLMAWSSDFYFVALLDAYTGPTPVVSELVQRQLLQPEEAETIREAVKRQAKGNSSDGSLYSGWLSHSGLDFEKKSTALADIVESGALQRAMFDLTMGQRVKSFQLGKYTEVHRVRRLIEDVLSDYRRWTSFAKGSEKLWWDEIDPGLSHSLWANEKLRVDVDFVPLLESWVEDGEELQGWLDRFELETKLHQNPTGQHPIFSAATAVEIVRFAKVCT